MENKIKSCFSPCSYARTPEEINGPEDILGRSRVMCINPACLTYGYEYTPDSAPEVCESFEQFREIFTAYHAPHFTRLVRRVMWTGPKLEYRLALAMGANSEEGLFSGLSIFLFKYITDRGLSNYNHLEVGDSDSALVITVIDLIKNKGAKSLNYPASYMGRVPTGGSLGTSPAPFQFGLIAGGSFYSIAANVSEVLTALLTEFEKKQSLKDRELTGIMRGDGWGRMYSLKGPEDIPF